MKFPTLYRASVGVMLVLSTLVLNIDAGGDNRFAPLFAPAVAAAVIASYFFVDRRPGFGLARGTANVLGFATFGLAFMEFWADENLLVLALGHWLVYLTVVKLFLPKTVEDDWFLFLLGLVQVLVGGFLSQGDMLGFLLLAWAVVSLWVLGLAYLHREDLEHRGTAQESANPEVPRTEPYRGLVDAPFVMSTILGVAVTLALGGVIFLITPRVGESGGFRGKGGGSKHLSGFSTEVRLGQMGEILENDSVVMTIEMFDEKGDRVAPLEGREDLWRGVTMGVYEDKKWMRQAIRFPIPADTNGPSGQGARLIQRIKIESNDSHVLFGLRPFESATASGNNAPQFNPVDGSLFREDLIPAKFREQDELRPAPKSGPYDYTVNSFRDTDQSAGIQPGESYPTEYGMERLLQIPKPLKERLRPIALAHVGKNPKDHPAESARALSDYLMKSGEFHYTLQLGAVDRKLDPVLDFLVNRKQGHCEYFASALTLLLRSIDIPARMVNGFKGGDWNQLTRALTVREKHAHTWVEALVGKVRVPYRRSLKEIQEENWITTITRAYHANPRFLPIWKVLDPTPGDERAESVAHVGGFWSRFRTLNDSIRFIWIFYILGFNGERQQRVLYDPLIQLASEARRGFDIMWEGLRTGLAWLLGSTEVSFSSIVSIRGFFVSVTLMLLMVGIFKAARWALRILFGRGRERSGKQTALAAGVAFYRRVALLLAEYGLERPPTETPREFARRASLFLKGHGEGGEAVADVPPLVVDAFYSVRYGQVELSSEALRRLDARLDALEASLRAASA